MFTHSQEETQQRHKPWIGTTIDFCFIYLFIIIIINNMNVYLFIYLFIIIIILGWTARLGRQR